MRQLSTFRLYLLGIGLLFAGYVALEYNRPKPLDWTPTYFNKDKIPYGTFVLFDQLPRLLGTDSVAVVRLPAYSQLTGAAPDAGVDVPETPTGPPPAAPDSAADLAPDSAAPDSAAAAVPADSVATTDSADSGATRTASPSADSTAAADSEEEATDSGTTVAAADSLPLRPERANYLFINDGFAASRPDLRALLGFVARGNDVFITADDFGGPLGRALGVRTDDTAPTLPPGAPGRPRPDSVTLRFTNPALAGARYRLPAAAGARLVLDSVTGPGARRGPPPTGRTLATDAQGRAVLLRLDHGAGHFYLCSVPLAFTNYYFLQPRTAGFAAGALAYLPARQTWWDEYQKQGALGEQSLLRVLLAHPALRGAYYLTLLGALLFVLVEARRRQRIIPTLKPLPNTTLLFTRTVAGLYRQGRNHALIAEKKVALFLDYLRVRFHEASPDLGDNDFRERLSQKAGLPRARVDELLRLVNLARTAPQIDDRALLQLSRAINAFRREVSR
ncbi:DUF4350 domain-containing protein [Hymenobacter caeli]|uniref:DUF4350 domain-containing protein n=1 Tax=Hymenobacter caeli TaxID=2735894 RepID=A0ABX2FQ32_9BACT|nr:DUF4350 domain-containing protein [Hymenobacter caeli]NRT19106.1 hypothetical protein [Hymenobacter caeli]